MWWWLWGRTRWSWRFFSKLNDSTIPQIALGQAEQEQGLLGCTEQTGPFWPAPRCFYIADRKTHTLVLRGLMWHCKRSFAVCCFVWPIADTSTFCHLANFVLPSYSFRPVVWKRRHLIVNRALYRVIVYDFPWLLRCCSNYSWLSKLFFLKIIPFIYLLMILSPPSHAPFFIFFLVGTISRFPVRGDLAKWQLRVHCSLRYNFERLFIQALKVENSFLNFPGNPA